MTGLGRQWNFVSLYSSYIVVKRLILLMEVKIEELLCITSTTELKDYNIQKKFKYLNTYIFFIEN